MNEDKRIADALERIAWAVESFAKLKDRTFRPALPDPYDEARKAEAARAEGKPYVPPQ
jgi:hypothetical protein